MIKVSRQPLERAFGTMSMWIFCLLVTSLNIIHCYLYLCSPAYSLMSASFSPTEPRAIYLERLKVNSLVHFNTFHWHVSLSRAENCVLSSTVIDCLWTHVCCAQYRKPLLTLNNWPFVVTIYAYMPRNIQQSLIARACLLKKCDRASYSKMFLRMCVCDFVQLRDIIEKSWVEWDGKWVNPLN